MKAGEAACDTRFDFRKEEMSAAVKTAQKSNREKFKVQVKETADGQQA